MALMDFNISEAGTAISGLFTGIREAITGKKIEDPQVQAEISYKFAELESKWEGYKTKAMELQHNVIIAEAKGESWLQRNWRPVTMLTFVFIIANNYILVPYASAIFGATIPTLKLTTDMWDLIQLGLGGYVLSRSGEKMLKTYVEAKK